MIYSSKLIVPEDFVGEHIAPEARPDGRDIFAMFGYGLDCNTVILMGPLRTIAVPAHLLPLMFEECSEAGDILKKFEWKGADPDIIFKKRIFKRPHGRIELLIYDNSQSSMVVMAAVFDEQGYIKTVINYGWGLGADAASEEFEKLCGMAMLRILPKIDVD